MLCRCSGCWCLPAGLTRYVGSEVVVRAAGEGDELGVLMPTCRRVQGVLLSRMPGAT